MQAFFNDNFLGEARFLKQDCYSKHKVRIEFVGVIFANI